MLPQFGQERDLEFFNGSSMYAAAGDSSLAPNFVFVASESRRAFSQPRCPA